jgi:PIN domain nuclease of toxin-antitoxin system
LRLPEPFEAMLERAGLILLPIRLDHVRAVMRLPFHHRDPFDRMLVAQAHQERLVLVSADRRIARYDVPVLA